MSVTTRIRLVSDIATSVGVAVAVLVLFGVWASVDDLPGVSPLTSAGGLMGVLLTTTICVALALSLAPNARPLPLKSEIMQRLQPQTSYRFPPA
jgi:hypothetical protein